MSVFLFGLTREMRFSSLPGYSLRHIYGALLGVLLTHAMFRVDRWDFGQRARWEPRLWFSEFVAIRPVDVLPFCLSQLAAVFIAAPFASFLEATRKPID
jgi:hypothetical protein